MFSRLGIAACISSTGMRQPITPVEDGRIAIDDNEAEDVHSSSSSDEGGVGTLGPHRPDRLLCLLDCFANVIAIFKIAETKFGI